MHFDAEMFDALKGFHLAKYALPFLKGSVVDDDILPYFDRSASSMDLEHLEYAIALLGKTGSDAAYKRVANYIEHPNFSIRAVATGILASASTVDETTMSRVIESLMKDEGDPNALSQQLRVLLDRPANAQAQRIATEYRIKLGLAKT